MCQALLQKHCTHCPVNLHKTALSWVLFSSPFHRYWNWGAKDLCALTKIAQLRSESWGSGRPVCPQSPCPPSLGRNLHLKQAPSIPGPTTPLLRARLLSLLSMFIFTHVSVISDLLLYLPVDVYFLTYFCLSPHRYPRLTGLRKKVGWTPLYLVWGFLFIPWIWNGRFTYLCILLKTYTIIPFYYK